MTRKHTALFFLLIALFPASTNALDIRQVYVMSSVDNAAPSEKPSFALSGQAVKLYCVVHAVAKGKHYYYTDADQADTGNNAAISPWDKENGKISIRWYKVEPYMFHASSKGNDPDLPEVKWYANAHFPFCPKNRDWIGYDRIDYKETELKEMRDKWSIPADSHPTDPRYDINAGLGVMRYKAVVIYDGGKKQRSSPGAESVNQYGITDKVHMVDFRKDDTMRGWLTAFFNVPGVFGSETKQVDGYTGIDCADLVVAAYKRHAGKKMGYTNVAGLIRTLKKPVDDFYLFGDGSLRVKPDINSAKAVIKFGTDIQEGDIIFFDYPGDPEKPYGSWDHVGTIFKDMAGDGQLGKEDIVMHAGFEEPHLSLLGSEGFTGPGLPTRVRIGRFKE